MEEYKNEMVWVWARVAFYISIILYIFYDIQLLVNDIEFTSPITYILGFSWLGFCIASFVLSIVHLTRYKKKGFAVTALVIQSLFLLVVLLGALSAV